MLGEQPVALAVSPDGHYTMVGPFDDEFVYTVLTEDGRQITLTAAEFAEKYGWKNDPDKVQLLPTAE